MKVYVLVKILILLMFTLTSINLLCKHIAESLEGNESENEILSALKNKTPGSDGFTVEFFKFFWNDIKSSMVSAIQYMFEHKELPISQRLGIISCLPRGDKPRHFF